MVQILLIGASGLVGRHVLARAEADARISGIVAPTRRPLPAHAKLVNPLVDFDALPAEADWWSVDAVICTLGTTRAKAGSEQAFRIVDHDYPLAFARLAQAHGATRFALTSSMGADAGSRFFYLRTKGELEENLRKLAFPSLTLVRPGLIGGERGEIRAADRIAKAVLGTLAPLLPRRYRVSPADRIAETLVDAVVEGRPGIHVIEADRLA